MTSIRRIRGALRFASVLALFCTVALAQLSKIETGTEAWLRYSALTAQAAQSYQSLPSHIVLLGDSASLKTAEQELVRGVAQMLGETLQEEGRSSPQSAIVLGTLSQLHVVVPALHPAQQLRSDGYWLKATKIHGSQSLIVAAANDRGVLYGVFALLSKIARGESLAHIDEVQQPYAPVRWVNQWDNLDGRIERGYGGPSIFFERRKGPQRFDPRRRVRSFAGIDRDQWLHHQQRQRSSGCSRRRLSLRRSAASQTCFDPGACSSRCPSIWAARKSWVVSTRLIRSIRGSANGGARRSIEIYRHIPDFGGFVVKADSEGRLGPSTYGRTPADAANVIARALKPHGGVVFYRAFVYNHHLDWHDLKNDRAKAAYDNFHPLDGAFDDNVIIQIKNGPIDFQVREPASPLFAGLHRNERVHRIADYAGVHRPAAPPVFSRSHVERGSGLRSCGLMANATPVKDLVAGSVFHRPVGGFVGVANVGMDANWLGSPLAMANLYGFGRLAWNPNLSAETIVDEWTRLTFGSDPLVVKTISAMQLSSWHIYESYTGPLGAGTLTDITRKSL